ncbi:unnamed protein product [Blepharisma stoltei]|uniref:Uncharacterized protein n=1 Tax=Blepharisma stoltei TaxID=1481888 RepID=A0AAU9JB70_9CILI|nr:unnamed protein product [Blepharisma stoltei]
MQAILLCLIFEHLSKSLYEPPLLFFAMNMAYLYSSCHDSWDEYCLDSGYPYEDGDLDEALAEVEMWKKKSDF